MVVFCPGLTLSAVWLWETLVEHQGILKNVHAIHLLLMFHLFYFISLQNRRISGASVIQECALEVQERVRTRARLAFASVRLKCAKNYPCSAGYILFTFLSIGRN